MKIACFFLSLLLWCGLAGAEADARPAMQEPTARGMLGDPTKVTPAFERSYRELAAETRAVAPVAGRPVQQNLPEVRLLGRVNGKTAADTSATLQIGTETLLVRAGQEASVVLEGQVVRVAVEEMNGQAVRVRLSNHSEPFILH